MKKQKKITIIEDDYSLLQMYILKFEVSNFAVSSAENGRYGLEVIEDERPDIILLDLMMPDMTGDQMLRELHKQPWGKKIPVIIMSNVLRDDAMKLLKGIEISDYIVKANSTPQIVLEKVNKILGNAKGREHPRLDKLVI